MSGFNTDQKINILLLFDIQSTPTITLKIMRDVLSNFWTIRKTRLSHNNWYVNCCQITYQHRMWINEYLPNIWGDSRKKYLHIKHCLNDQRKEQKIYQTHIVNDISR